MRRFITAAGLIFASVTICLAATWPKKGDVVYMPVVMDTIAVGAYDWTAERHVVLACAPLKVKKVTRSGAVSVVTVNGTKYDFCGPDVRGLMYASGEECHRKFTAKPATTRLAGNGCHALTGPK